MTARRVVALLAAAATALLIPAIVRAGTYRAMPVLQAQSSQASLLVDPSSGAPDAAFAVHYAVLNGQCGSGDQVQLSWQGSVWVSRPASSHCSASWRALVPPQGTAPGSYDVQAVLLNCQNGCTPVDQSQADAMYTVTADAHGDVTATPTAAETATPQPTPTPTLLAVSPGGTFPAHACTNGIPDTTPCPTAAGEAVASAPPTPTPLPSTGGSDPVSVPWSTIGYGAVFLAAVLAAVLVLGWRQGAAGRRRLPQAGPGGQPVPPSPSPRRPPTPPTG